MSTDVMSYIGAALSLVCSGALITNWCLLPRWRTLLNYVSMNQIITGSLNLCSSCLLELNLSERILEIVILINGYLFLASLCWSLSASLISYLKLVLAYPGKITYEKRKATLFSYGLLFITKLVTDCFIAKVFRINEFITLVAVRFLPMYAIVTVNLFAFVKVVLTVMSCNKTRMSKLRGGHVVSLIGVGFVCDMLTTISMMMILIEMYKDSENTIWVNVLSIRLIPQALVVLFNKKSRDIWRKYLERKRNNKLNNMQLQNRQV